MKPLGLYLHIPFCRSKCLYCDFCSQPHATGELLDRYVSVLCRDLHARAEACRDYCVDTVYFGGGTPTILTSEQLERLLQTVTDCFSVAADAEITAECNPAAADREKLLRMRHAGFNRLSIGLQSMQKNELKALGRLHDASDFYATWEVATDAGFANLSADVMFGIPQQTEESFADTLQRLLACRPRHISAYVLTVEPGTPFGRRGEAALELPDEDTVSRMYLGMVDRLCAGGLRQYEISNFAVPGYESRHNLKYWNTEEYLGVGPAAHSDLGGARFGNKADIKGYLAGACGESERSCPDKDERLQEYVMLQMRLARGLQRDAMAARFGADATERFCRRLQAYVPGGFAEQTEKGYRLTPRGMLVSNAILADILEL